MFDYQPPPRGNRVAIVSVSGGAGVLSADACIQNGLRVAELDNNTLQKIAEKMPSWAKVSNPADIEPLAETVGADDAYRIACGAAISDENADICLIIMGTTSGPEATARFLEDIKNMYPQKPVAVCILGKQQDYRQLFHAIEEIKIPVFDSVRRAVNGLAALHRYNQLKS